MAEFIHFIQSTGEATLPYLWFPVIIWTIIAAPVTLFLQRTETIPPVYQYHSRMALLFALPLGVAGSYLIKIIGEALTSTQAVTAKFIVIQNPITVSAGSSQAALWGSLSDPLLWIGLANIILAIGAIYYLLRFIHNSILLKNMGNDLEFKELEQIKGHDIIHDSNRYSNRNPLIAFSRQANIPFTYGWINTKIVIPADLKKDPDKMAMAIRHELMHIKHRDFLLNGILLMLKALFWFHPLIHHLYESSQEYREITCDGEVLSDKQFSRKRYAALLYELAEREYSNSTLAKSMAVNPSSLKKRIQIMTTQNISPSAFRSSFMLTLVTAGLVVLTISCSDLNNEDGITNTEFQQAQAQMSNQAEGDQPLYVINGAIISENEVDAPNALSRIKGEYIYSIDILKGQNAIDAYGEEGRNGVIKIALHDGIDIDMVFSDLKEEGSVVSPSPPHKDPDEEFYVAVEQMPELIGGLEELQKELTYPQEAHEAGDEGRVIIQFIVNKQGEVEKPQIIRGVSESLDQEALRVVKQAQFKPGMQQGQPVRVQYSLPIIFRSSSSITKMEPKVDVETPKMEGAEMNIEDLQISENGTLSGKVVSIREDSPLPGANIVIEGTTTGTSTNQYGEFSIQNVEKGTHNLVISYIGYDSAVTEIEIE